MIDKNTIDNEEQYDGFYCVATNLEGKPNQIIEINKQRWQIEASFRTMKHDFKSRPVNHRLDKRIEAHFLTCYLALVVFKLLEKKINEEYTTENILDTLRNMNWLISPKEGYLTAYTRTNLTDKLQDTFGFKPDYQINTFKNVKKIIKNIKNKKH